MKPQIALLALVGICALWISNLERRFPATRSGMLENGWENVRTEKPNIDERMKLIRAELASAEFKTPSDLEWSREWAGQYFAGDGLGESVLILVAPQNGIAYLTHGCGGLYAGDHGTIDEVGQNELKISLRFGSAKNSFLSERMYLVKWGNERLLVSDWQMMGFIESYNKGGVSRMLMDRIARRVSEENPVRKYLHGFGEQIGRPELPPQFASMLRDKPIELTIKTIQPISATSHANEQKFAIEFQGGTHLEVYKGLTFRYPDESPPNCGLVHITRVDVTSCSGELVIAEPNMTKIALPKVGDKIMINEAD